MASARKRAMVVAVAVSLLLGLLLAFLAGRDTDQAADAQLSLLRGLLGNFTTQRGRSNSVAPAGSVASSNGDDPPHARLLSAGDGPDFSVDTNPYYKVLFDSKSAVVIQNYCQGAKCRLRGANNIASVTMKEAGDSDSFVPIRVVVTKLSYEPSADGVGWNIRPSHLQDEGVIKDVDSGSIETAGSISFTVTAPCQVSVELGSEDILFENKRNYWGFSNLIIAANPPESSWPRQKPHVIEDNQTGALTCKSDRPNRACIIGQADDSCAPLLVPANTDIYFTSRASKTYRWKDGCGRWPKKIRPATGAAIFLDEDVVVHASIHASGPKTGVYGYGIISNFYMHGRRNQKAQSNVISLRGRSHVFGVIVMDSTYRNIRVARLSTVAWTKSFAWEGQTDGVNLAGTECHVHNNFFKVNDDVLKAYQSFTIFRDNVIWHQTIGRALMLSWGNPGENREDRNGTTQIIGTSIIHDYRTFERLRWSKRHPGNLGRIKNLIMWATLISAQHSMPNAIGEAGSPILIKDLHVEGAVGVLMSMTTGFLRLGNRAGWQSTASPGCGGGIYVQFDNLDMRRVRRMHHDSAVGGCDMDFSYNQMANAECLCTTEKSCPAKSQCQLSLDFLNLKDSESDGVPKLADAFHVGANADIQGLTTRLLI